jgi:hypothetical protein
MKACYAHPLRANDDQGKRLLAASHATATGTFANGAYITDPVRFVSVLRAQSSFITLAGALQLNVGLTHVDLQCSRFEAAEQGLLVELMARRRELTVLF